MAPDAELLRFRQLQAQVRQGYADSARARTPEYLLSVLRFLTVHWEHPWTESDWDAGHRLGYLRAVEPSQNDELISPIIATLEQAAKWPFFYRLNFVKQLATTSHAVCLDAGHPRLAHLLGTVSVAARILQDLGDAGDTEVAAVLIYAFLHDVYHGPLGHVLDGLAPIFLPLALKNEFVHKKVDKTLLCEAVREAAHSIRQKASSDDAGTYAIVQVIRSVARVQTESHESAEDEQALKIADILQILVEGGESERVFLQQLVDSDVDADRLDFVWRDARHLTATSDVSILVNKIVGSALVKTEDQQASLQFTAASEVRELLRLRRNFYRDAYEHETKLAVDVVIERALIRLLQHYGCIDGDQVLSSAMSPTIQKELRRRLFLLTDSELFHFLGQLCVDDQAVVGRVLLEDATLNRAWTRVVRKDISLGELPDILWRRKIRDATATLFLSTDFQSKNPKIGERSAEAFHQVSLALNNGASEFFGLLKRFKVHVDELEEYDPTEFPARIGRFSEADTIYDLHIDLGWELSRRIDLEQQLWTLCLKDSGFAEQVSSYNRRLGLTEVDEPWLLAHVASIPDALDERTARMHSKEPAGSGPRQTVGELEDRASARLFPFMIFLPPTLAANRACRVTVEKAVDTMLATRAWF